MNATLILEWNGKTYTYPAQWVESQIIIDEKIVDDIYGGGDMEEEWNAGNHPNFTIQHDETGQTSRVSFEDEIWEFLTHEPVN